MKIKNNKGFVGVDTSIAIIILLIFIPTITAMIYNINKENKNVERKSKALNFAVNVMETAKGIGMKDLTLENMEKEITNLYSAEIQQNSNTNKTQYIYRINKGILNVNDNSVNDHMDHDIRPIPMTNMIYIGDSATDIPCMRLIMKSGGYAIGVYKEGEKSEQYLSHLINENRINFTAKTDYSKNSELEKIIKEIILTIKHKDNLKQLTRKCKTK